MAPLFTFVNASLPLRTAAFQGLSLAPGIFPLAVLFGALSISNGFTTLQATLMSGFVFSGIAQFAVLASHESGQGPIIIAATVSVILVRYMLLGSVVLETARQHGASMSQRISMALTTVEETYAVQTAWIKRGGHGATGLVLSAGIVMVVWLTGTVLGATIGDRLPDLQSLGLDYVMPGLFVGIFALFADKPSKTRVGLLCGAIAAGMALAGFGVVASIALPPLAALVLGRRA